MSSDPNLVGTSDELLTDLLRSVSRSFYLTLRILPAPVRRPISIAYLLARASDTIADTELIDARKRVESLTQFDQAIQAVERSPCDFGDYLSHQNKGSERELLQRCDEALSLLDTVDTEDRASIRNVLKTIISGQRLDLERFRDASHDRVICLQLAEDTDDYTYRVAGCVGEFWTKVCFKHLAPKRKDSMDQLVQLGIRFGKGLQLVNILRDFQEDLQQGRCYLPAEKLAAAGLDITEITSPDRTPQFSSIYQDYVSIARAHLKAGWEYTNLLPWSWIRLRLACAWPILLGVKTLDLLPADSPLGAANKPKVSRSEVKKIIAKSILLYPFQRLWQRLPGDTLAESRSESVARN